MADTETRSFVFRKPEMDVNDVSAKAIPKTEIFETFRFIHANLDTKDTIDISLTEELTPKQLIDLEKSDWALGGPTPCSEPSVSWSQEKTRYLYNLLVFLKMKLENTRKMFTAMQIDF